MRVGQTQIVAFHLSRGGHNGKRAPARVNQESSVRRVALPPQEDGAKIRRSCQRRTARVNRRISGSSASQYAV
ncbi:hypothetical protein SAMN04487895_103435 [Paenibacillus sophorae]|uniref:Uncharacterized protein n=1 Tax=Paenibacillus sophorae TaxID=1333845 RepID=A0A1H8KGE9_9BACL|nr:hypothetical protein SAMN04487895_103435 [Paenibacillus sophorae]